MGQPPPPPQPPWSVPPPYGQPPQDQPPFGQPPQDQPPFGQPPFGQPPYGQPAFGSAPYGPPPGATPQPGWPGQPTYGPATPPRRGGGGKVVGIVLAVVAALVVLCGGAGVVAYLSGAFGGGDPVQVVEDYYAAAQQGDCDRMVELVTDATWRQDGATSQAQAVSECEQSMAALGGPGFRMSLEDAWLVSEDGDTAVVRTTFVPPPLQPGEDVNDPGRDPVSVDITLRKEGRSWLIDGTSAGGGFGLGPPELDIPELPELPDLEGTDPDLDPDTEPGPDPGTPEPLTSDELYSAPSFTFRITLSDRVLEGELVRIEAYDHANCDAAARTDAVRTAMATCQNRIEAAYVGASDDLWVTQQVLMFADVASAESFYQLLENDYAGDLISFEDPGNMDASGYLASRIGHQGHFVVLTLLASSSDSEAAIQAVQDHAHARHAESMAYFIWR